MRKIEIPVTGIFSEKELLWFLDRGFDECVYKVFPDKIRRAFEAGNERMLVDIYPLRDRLVVAWLTGEPSENGINFVRDFLADWFDLDIDLTPFYGLLSPYPRLDYLSKRYEGLRFTGIPDLFEALAWAIIGQQINLRFAYTIKRRLVEAFGSFVEYEGNKYYLFPSPATIAKARVPDLRAMQFSGKKAEYLITVAEAIASKAIDKTILNDLPDMDSRLKMLTNLRGIGHWTASYVLMKSLKERSSIPYGDAGLLNALVNHGIITEKNELPAIRSFFSGFAGWESYLVFYLWRSLAPMEGDVFYPRTSTGT